MLFQNLISLPFSTAQTQKSSTLWRWSPPSVSPKTKTPWTDRHTTPAGQTSGKTTTNNRERRYSPWSTCSRTLIPSLQEAQPSRTPTTLALPPWCQALDLLPPQCQAATLALPLCCQAATLALPLWCQAVTLALPPWCQILGLQPPPLCQAGGLSSLRLPPLWTILLRRGWSEGAISCRQTGNPDSCRVVRNSLGSSFVVGLGCIFAGPDFLLFLGRV